MRHHLQVLHHHQALVSLPVVQTHQVKVHHQALVVATRHHNRLQVVLHRVLVQVFLPHLPTLHLLLNQLHLPMLQQRGHLWQNQQQYGHQYQCQFKD